MCMGMGGGFISSGKVGNRNAKMHIFLADEAIILNIVVQICAIKKLKVILIF